MSQPPVLGIDLGTTNSVVAVADGQRVRVLLDEQGNRLLPSVVSFHPQGEVLVGYAARERRLIDAENTIYSVKRLIGRPWNSDEVRRAQERFAFKLGSGPNGGVLVEARGESFTLPEISAFVLREIRRIAEVSTNEACTRAVVTVPANFNELQRAATKAAGKVAGLDVLRILNEPTAAALAYGYGRGGHERIAVYDLGGGTFDVTILDLAGDLFEVLSTAGDTFLGGDDVDLAIAEKMADRFLAQHRVDLRQDQQAYERLRAAAEWAKCQLSVEKEVTLRVEELAYGPGGVALDLSFSMTRPELDTLITPLVERAFEVCEEAMRTAMIRPTQLDNVILVGGSTRIPLVRERVADYFGREPLSSIDPDLVVAQGAALQAYALRSEQKGAPNQPVAKVPLRKSTLMGGRIGATAAEEKRLGQPAFAPAPTKVAPPPPRAPIAPPPGLFDGYEGSGEEATTVGPRPERPKAKEPSVVQKGPGVPRPPTQKPPPAPPTRAQTGKMPPLEGAIAVATVAITRTATVGEAPPAIPPPRVPASRPATKSQPPVSAPISSPEMSGLAGMLEPESDELPYRVPEPRSPKAPSSGGWPAATQSDIGWPGKPGTEPGTQPARPGTQPGTRKPGTSPGAQEAPSPWPPPAATVPQAAWQPPPPAMQPQAAWPPPAEPAWAPPPQPSPPAVPAAPPPALPSVWPSQAAPAQPASWAPPEISLPMPAAAPPLLLDVTPHSLGVETVGGYCEVVIRRNAAIPVEQTRVFATAQDDQSIVVVNVVQGEARESASNQHLGTIELGGIRPALRGQVRIAVTFVMGQDGTLAVDAKDLESGRVQSVRVSLVGSMTDADVAGMTRRQESMLGRAQ